MANLLTNGDFASGLTSWAQSPSGCVTVASSEAVFVSTGSSARLYQSGFSITNGVTYRISFRARSAVAGLVLGLRLCTAASDSTVIGIDSTQALTTSNVDYSFTFTATATNSNARWRFKLESAGTAYIDNVVLDTATSILAGFTGSPVTGTAPTTVTFTNTSTGSPTGFTWEYSKDGGAWTSLSTSSGNPTYNFTLTGTYGIRLTVTKAAETDILTRASYIVISGGISADFTGTPLSGAITLSVTFTDASTASNGITTRTWFYNRNGAGWTQFSTSTNPVYGFTAGGTYAIRLVIVGPDGTSTRDRLAYVTATGGVVAGFTGTPLSGAVPYTITFTDASSGTIVSRSWEYQRNGAGWIEFSTATNPTLALVLAGTYDFRLTASSSTVSDTLTRTAYASATGSDTIAVHVYDETGIEVGTVLSTFAFSPETYYFLTASYDAATGNAILYVDGSAVQTEAIGTHNLYGIGNIHVGQASGYYSSNIVMDELFFLNRAIHPDEVRAVYESNAPVFAETSTWHWRAGRNRLWADTEGLWMVNASGTKVLAAYAGDEDDPNAFKTWGGVNLYESDVLIGDASRGGYVKWDDSAATMEVAGQIVILAGSTGYANIVGVPDSLSDINSTEATKLAGIAANATVGATWGTNINSIPTRFGDTPGAAGLYLTSTHLGYYNGSAWKAWLASSGEFYFGGSSGAHLEWNGTKLRGIGTDGTTEQWYAQSTDGKLYAGAGSVWLDSAGVNLNSAASFQDSLRVKWWDGANKQFWIGASGLAGTQATLWAENAADDVLMDLLAVVPSTSQSATIRLQASQGAATTQWNFVRTVGGAANASFDSSLTVAKTSGTNNVATFTGSAGATEVDQYGNLYATGTNASAGVVGTGIVSFRINNTGYKDWRIESARTAANGSLEFTNVTDAISAPRLILAADGNIGINGASFGSGTGVLFIANRSVNPSTNPSGGGVLYADGGAGKWRGSSGTITTFANAEPHCPVCGADYMKEFDSEKWGYFAICLRCLADEVGQRDWIIRGETKINE